MREEAWRNCRTGTASAITLMFTVLVLTLALGSSDALAVASLDSQMRQYVSRGGAVTILEAPGRVDPVLCANLATHPGVKNTGVLKKHDSSQLLNLPGRTIPTYNYSGNLLHILKKQPVESRTGVAISQEAAELLQVRSTTPDGPARFIRTNRGNSAVVNIYDYPDDGRMRGLGYALLIPTPALGTFDQCWVEQWPASHDVQRAIRAVTSPHVPPRSDDKTTVFPWNGSLGEPPDTEQLFRGRVTRWAAALVGIISACMGFAAIRRRKIEIAANLHLGLSRKNAHQIALLEAALWLAPTLLIGCSAAFIHAGFQPTEDFLVNALRNCLAPVTAVLCGIAGTVMGVCSIAERHLFNYFKDR